VDATWIQAWRVPISLLAMSDEHVRNALRTVQYAHLPPGWSPFSSAEWRRIFAAELQRRERLRR
jgi:hypothetical protein